MEIHEIDWRIEPLYDVIVGIDAALAEIRKRLRQEEWFDGLSAHDDAEPTLGLGFVAAQIYAVGTASDINSIRKTNGKSPVSKIECYRCDPIKIKGQVTRIEVINATANYFKHHDEWSEGWPDRETTRVLNAVGITERSEQPCIDATELFCGNSWEFVVVHQVVKEWRAHALEALR